MLARLIGFSIKYAVFVVMASVLLLVFTGVKLGSMPVDVFPELNAPTVVIMTEAPGFAADEVEPYITFPVETAVNGLPGVRRVRSASTMGLSIVWVEFDWGRDIYRARQLVSEKITSVRETLPPDAHVEMTPVTSITGEIMLLALSSPDGRASPMELRAFAEFDLRNRLLAVPGIAQVVAIGGELPEYQVHVHQDRLALYGLTMQDVVEATRAAHSSASAGYLPNVDRLEVPIRQTARVRGVEDIRGTMIRHHGGAPVLIGQIADVQLGPAPKRGTASDRAMPAVVLSVQKSPGANTLALTAAVDAALDEAEGSMPPGVVLNRKVFRQSSFINRSVDNVVVVMRDAAIVVAVVLVLFLMNARTTIITLTALPLSLAFAILILWWFELTINVMTLGGLAVAIGELVDDAIIDVENVFRRLRENAALPAGDRRPLVQVIYEASNEIRSSVVFATLIICMVFVPLLFLEGLEGRFFRPMGISYIVSILASLVVAMTVTPAMCRMLLGHLGGAAAHGDGFLVRWLKRRYEPSLRWSIRHGGFVLSAALVATLASLGLGSTFGTSFLPSFNEGTFTVFLFTPPGTSLDESNRVARGIEARLVEIDGVESVTRRTGRAERDEHAEPPSSSEIEVTMAHGASKEDIRARIDDVLADVPGVTTMIGQPIEHRLSHILSGTPAAIAINVYGDDLARLRRVAQDIETSLKALPGARDVAANREVTVTSLPLHYRREDLAHAGLTPASAAEQVREAIHGETVAEVHDGAKRFSLVVRLEPEERATVEQVRGLRLRGVNGAVVRLDEVADIGPQRTPNIIARENARRKAVVSCNVASGFNLGDLVAQVKERVDPIVRRAGYDVHYGGQFEAQQSASRTILVAGCGVAVVMLMMLHLSTGSVRVALLVMLNLPLAVIGGIAAVQLTETSRPLGNMLSLLGLSSAPYEAPIVSIASLVGFITLFGIAVRNGILLVNHYNHLITVDGLSRDEAVVRGSLERLSPILMTALCAALGLIPIALARGEPGSELLAPLAVVVLGGLVSSTFLNLVVVPAGYALVFGLRSGRAGRPGIIEQVVSVFHRWRVATEKKGD